MQQFYANGLAMPSKMDWKEECPFIVPSAARGTVPVDTPQIWVLFLAFCKPFFRKWVHKLKIWGHLFLTRVPLLEKRDPLLKKGVPLLLNRCYSTQIGVPFLSFRDPLSAKCISFFRRCDYILEKCVPLLGKRDSILGESDRTFITSERYLATCVPLSEKRDPILGKRDYTFITSERYFAIGDPLLVKCDPYFATCVPVSGKRTSVWQKRDIKISKRVHGKSICVPGKRKTVPKKTLFCVISSRKSLQASDPITTQAQPKNGLRITQQRPKVDPSLTQETAKDDLSLTQPRPSLRTGCRQGSPKDGTTNTQETANSDTRNARLMYRECTVSVLLVYRKGTGEVLKRYWRATKDSLNACSSGVDQLYGKSRRVVAAMTNKSMPFVLALICFSLKNLFFKATKNKVVLSYGLLCFMLFDLSDAWAQSAESRTAEGQTEIKPLKIGDTVPEEFWDKQHTFYRNGSLESKTLTAFKGTPLIVDFWSSWCGACVASLKKIDSLKATPIGEINFLIVTSQSAQNVDQFVSADKQIKKNAFESIVSDKILSSYFEYRFLPHVIWINSQGVVVSSSISHYVNAGNIKKLRQNRPLESIPPKVENIHFDPTKLLNNSEQATYSTVFIGIPGVKPQTISNDALDEDRNRTAYINYPALYLYRIGYGIGSGFPKSQIVIHVDSFRQNYLPSDPRTRYEWRKQNLYTYEAIYPVSHSSQEVTEQMQYDLDTFFNVSSSYTKKLVDCIVITSFTAIQNDTSAPGISLDAAIKHLNDNEHNRIVINEANEQGRIPLIPRITDWSQANILTILKDLGIEAHISPRHINLLAFEERRSEI